MACGFLAKIGMLVAHVYVPVHPPSVQQYGNMKMDFNTGGTWRQVGQ